MDHAALDKLRRTHPAWRLLSAEHAALVIGFLQQTFVQPNVRTLPQHDAVSRLDDYLYQLRAILGDGAFPRSAAQYLDVWAGDDHGWLRKYYPAAGDEPHFDLTPGTEKAITWVIALEQRQFVGTESRLMTVFELLRQLVEGTEADPDVRVAELEKRKAQLDAEIHRIRGGDVAIMDATQIKDRFQQMAATARGLLADFREVEQNFRDLDRTVRAEITAWEGSKGALLANVFGERDSITDSDQGKSFRAFWDLLMSHARQSELASMLEQVFALPAVQELHPDRRLLRVHHDWLEAGERAQRTVARVSEQLRRYLDDHAWLENRRIMQILREVELHALALRDGPPDGVVMDLDDQAPAIDLPIERPLFSPPLKPHISAQALEQGIEDLAADVLFEQVHVDKATLQANIRQALQTRRQVSLAQVVTAHPLEHGLAEVVAYVSVAADSPNAVIDDDRTETLVWTDTTRGRREARLPLVVFTR